MIILFIPWLLCALGTVVSSLKNGKSISVSEEGLTDQFDLMRLLPIIKCSIF